MKYNKDKILELRQKGLTIRAIMKELNIASPSTVQWHLTQDDRMKNWLIKNFVFPKKPAIKDGGELEMKVDLLNKGFNQYREMLLSKIAPELLEQETSA